MNKVVMLLVAAMDGKFVYVGESAEWTPVLTNKIEVPASGEQGFFIVVPSQSGVNP